MNRLFAERCQAIRRYLDGEPVSTIYCSLKRSPAWFRKWCSRFEHGGTDALYDLPHRAKTVANKTPPEVERAIVQIRCRLAAHRTPQTRYSLIGAATIQYELRGLGYRQVPPLRTIEAILQRHGLTVPTLTWKPAPPVKHYPQPRCQQSNDVHELDLVGPRYFHFDRRKHYFCVYKDAYDGAMQVRHLPNKQAVSIVEAVVHAWQTIGLPKVLQIDNALEFRGSNRWPRSLSRLLKLALACGVEVVFIPEHCPQRNGAVEQINGVLEELCLTAQHFPHQRALERELTRFEYAANHQHRHEQLQYQTSAEYRRTIRYRLHKLPKTFTLHQQTTIPLCAGKVSFIRQVRASGRITVLSEKVFVGKRLHGEYVKATLYTKEQCLKIYYQGNIIKQYSFKLTSSTL